MIVQNGKVKKSAGIQLPADLSIAFDYILLIRYLSVLLYQFFYFRNQIFFIAYTCSFQIPKIHADYS
mgnify:FL=1